MTIRNALADAKLQLDLTTTTLERLRNDPEYRDWDQRDYEIEWHERQLVADVQLVQSLCPHIWVPAGLEPDDPQVCARCNAER